MKLFSVTCYQCGATLHRSKRRINESKKLGWKIYCSLICQGKAKNKQVTLTCSNPQCYRIFERQRKDFRNYKIAYCSRSCAVSINNSKFPKRKALRKKCHYCSEDFVSREKYCSRECKRKDQVISKKEICKQIIDFYRKKGRIPLKREFYHYTAARNRFGSWNNAIKMAGFDPNPVMFAKKYVANDGHKCDSLAEKIIDDWLYARRIPHEINVPYNKNNMTADFRVNGILIEFLGLQGELRSYDRLVKVKKKLWKENRLKVIQIYPHHLLPKNKLDQVLKGIANG